VIDEVAGIRFLDRLARAPIWGLQLDRGWVTALRSDAVALRVCAQASARHRARHHAHCHRCGQSRQRKRCLSSDAAWKRRSLPEQRPPGLHRMTRSTQRHTLRTRTTPCLRSCRAMLLASVECNPEEAESDHAAIRSTRAPDDRRLPVDGRSSRRTLADRRRCRQPSNHAASTSRHRRCEHQELASNR